MYSEPTQRFGPMHPPALTLGFNTFQMMEACGHGAGVSTVGFSASSGSLGNHKSCQFQD